MLSKLHNSINICPSNARSRASYGLFHDLELPNHGINASFFSSSGKLIYEIIRYLKAALRLKLLTNFSVAQ